MAPGTFNTGVDKRRRAPDQVDVRQVQFLVDRSGAGRLDQRGRDFAVVHAEIDLRAQYIGPEVLVADLRAIGPHQRTKYRSIVQHAVGGEGRGAVAGVDGLPVQRAAEIGGEADIVGRLIANAVTPVETEGDVIPDPRPRQDALPRL